MSMNYSFRKADIPFETWLEKIEEVVIPADPGTSPAGTWREMMVSAMLRQEEDTGEDGYAERFLTEGSIRGVFVSEEEENIEIKLHTFASRSDQYLAARMAWEAMKLGAAVEKDCDRIQAEDLSAEAVEASHRQWFALSKAASSGPNTMQLPIYGFLALTMDGRDCEKDDALLEQELVERVARLGDAFVSSRMSCDIDGVGLKTFGILQPELHSLMEKDVDGVAFDGGIVPMDAFVEALGDLALDGHGCWVFPPASNIEPAILQSLAGKCFGKSAGALTQVGGPTDDEWNFIAQGPVLAFLLVASSDGNVDKKEIESFGKVVYGLASQQGNASVARMMSLASENIQEILPRLMSGKTNPLHLLQALNLLINDRFSEDDAQIIKTSLLFLAHQIAASSGGFLGIGPKISKNEKAALAALASVLDLISE